MEIKKLLERAGLKVDDKEMESLNRDLDNILEMLEKIPEPHNKSNKHTSYMQLRRDDEEKPDDYATTEGVFLNAKSSKDKMFKI